MINVTSKNCTGCRACEQRCPQNCISMQPDAEGFLVAKVDATQCIGCNLCNRICPQKHFVRLPQVQEAYAARYLADEEILQKSTSGGAFAAFAQIMLSKGGAVVGAVYADDFSVGHVVISSTNELSRLQGSKYVQSDTGYTYREVEALLKSDRPVLFSGTACQIAGLYAYLNHDYERLITVDVICHGVASPKLFSVYLDWLKKKEKSEICSYSFRSKIRVGWGNYGQVCFNSKKRYIASNDPYIKCYMSGFSYRECCYLCKYANSNRISDVTIGDFWGIQKTHPSLYDRGGVSAVVVNSLKGKCLLKESASCLFMESVEFADISTHNANLDHPSIRPKVRDTIYLEINQLPTECFIEKRLVPLVSRKDRLHALVPLSLKYFIKRIRGEF